jgi:hypothetical protein
MEAYLSAMLKQVDSSLLDAWERMQNPDFSRAETTLAMPGAEEAAQDITRDRKAFTAAIRARLFALLHACATEDWEEAEAVLGEAAGAGASPEDGEGELWTADRLKTTFSAYTATHQGPRLDPEGRNQRHTYVQPKPGDSRFLVVQQMLVDTGELNDWALEVEVDLVASREARQAVLQLVRCGEFR